uniref:Uncharacterized protein n=1 Tax=Alexandrium andersonii TaxID=327968 RepID=A0A7S2EZC7_9DINO|mmetsp:Transcript_100267/g.224683  ORF Transcript_100267/g.224683 Transcript_100267/m.224683 type:complete len:246 (+) Transcript_100267:3-740(+)
MFEQRCQTPRRDGETMRPRMIPRSEPHDIRSSRISREDSQARAAPPSLPRPVGTAPQPPPSFVPPMPQSAQTTPTISVTPPKQAGTQEVQRLQRSNSLQVPGVAAQPGAPSSNIQALAAQFQARPTQEQQVLSGRPGVRPPMKDLELAMDEDEVMPEQVEMGMSPIRREPAEPVAQAAGAGGHLREPMAASLASSASAPDARSMGVGASAGVVGGSAAARQAVASRESTLPEVPVSERIRKLQGR